MKFDICAKKIENLIFFSLWADGILILAEYNFDIWFWTTFWGHLLGLCNGDFTRDNSVRDIKSSPRLLVMIHGGFMVTPDRVLSALLIKCRHKTQETDVRMTAYLLLATECKDGEM